VERLDRRPEAVRIRSNTAICQHWSARDLHGKSIRGRRAVVAGALRGPLVAVGSHAAAVVEAPRVGCRPAFLLLHVVPYVVQLIYLLPSVKITRTGLVRPADRQRRPASAAALPRPSRCSLTTTQSPGPVAIIIAYDVDK